LERERVFEQVIARVEPPRASVVRLVRPALMALLPAAAALFLWLRPDAPGELTARGGGPTAPHVQVLCTRDGKQPAQCAAGDVLAFEIAAPAAQPHLALLGRRADGTVIWFAPAPDARAARLSSERQVLSQGARLAPEDVAGKLRVFAVFSAEPLSRAEVREALTADQPPSEVTTLERELRWESAP
jgi:hypothetical protein